jgi:tetratricopeptide (TPR) repeat protein
MGNAGLGGTIVGAHVFISYSSKDSKFARAICSALESRGLPCWISSRDVGPGENFMDAIVHAIGAAQVMVLVFSENANNSEDIKREIVLASSGKVTIIPVRVEDVAPKGAFAYQFATRQWIDLFEDWEAQIERLAKWIAGTASAAPDAPAKAEPEKPIPDARATGPGSIAEEQGRQQADTEARRIAEEKRRQEDAERAEEEERRKRAEAEARQRAEQERFDREAEAKRRADQERAYAAAKLADTVSAVEEFLAAYPESHLAGEAKALRTALIARDEACKVAMASDDAAVLKKFLKTYPTGAAAEQVRGRLQGLAPKQRRWTMRRVLAVGGLIGLGLIGLIGVLVLRSNAEFAREVDFQNCRYQEIIAACNRVIADVTETIRRDPTNVAAFNKRAIAYQGERDYDHAIADFNEAIKLNPAAAAGFNNRGDAYYAKQDYDHAITDYSEAIRLEPNDNLNFANRGRAYVAKRDYSRAIADYNEAIRLYPEFALGFDGRGYAYYAKQDYDHAIADYNEAIRLMPDVMEFYRDRAAAYYAKKDYDHAIADYTEVIESGSDSVSYYNRGSAYYYKRDYDHAIADFNEAIKLNPQFAGALEYRADAYYVKSDYDHALADYNEAIRLNPKVASALFKRGMVKARKGDDAGAKADTAAAKKLDPNVDK